MSQSLRIAALRIAARRPLAVALLLALGMPCGAFAADAPPPATDAGPTDLDAVRVEATRLRGVSPFDQPSSVDVIDLREPADGIDINLSERLGGVPGVLARDRQNYAQDTQLSIRGFGARSTFGVRGVRLVADGIPATMPDGQGQVSNFSLFGADRVEVLRGPFSALHGNSSGGVVQIHSADGEAGDPWRVRATYGNDATYTAAAQLLGGRENAGYNVAVSHFDTDGARDHSEARRDSANAKFLFKPWDGGRFDLVLNYVDIDAQDPLGLDRAQLRADPDQATPQADQFNTRKTVRQSQAGLVFEQAWGAQTVHAMAYAGQRDVMQVLAIPPSAQANPLNGGGVIDLANRYGGGDVRWSWQGDLLDRPLEVTVGANSDRQRQDRTGYENFTGTGAAQVLGVRGRLRRDEANRVGNDDQFAQAYWKFAPKWALQLGVRHSSVDFTSDDYYVVGPNPDDSGSKTYSDTTPVAGLVFSPDASTRLYVSAGRGFETPTFNELGYRADGGAGLAFDLNSSTSDNYEIGGKWRGPDGLLLQGALFRAASDDELAVASNVGGRSSYRNVGKSRRQGAEVSLLLPLSDAWQVSVAYTYLEAEFRSAYLICATAGCTVPNAPVAAGSRIPGVPKQQVEARLAWEDAGWGAAIEGVGVGNVVVNDLATESAAGYFVVNLEGSKSIATHAGDLRLFGRLDNVLDQDYVGSVIVNEGNARYYEPGARRGVTIGAQFAWR